MISGVRGRLAGPALGVVTSWSGDWAVAACTSCELYVGRCTKVTVLSGALVSLVASELLSSGGIASCGRCSVVDALRGIILYERCPFLLAIVPLLHPSVVRAEVVDSRSHYGVV